MNVKLIPNGRLGVALMALSWWGAQCCAAIKATVADRKHPDAPLNPKRSLSAMAVILGLFLTSAGPVAGASTSTTILTAASGGSPLSADNLASGAWTSLAGPVMTESGGGGAIAGTTLGTIVLNAPAGFQFNPAAAVTVKVVGSATATANVNHTANNGTIAAVVTSSTVTISITALSSTTNTLTWQNIQVRPTSGTAPVSANITLGGTAVSKGLSAGANCGTLTEVAGAAASVRVETSASGAGTVVPAQTIGAGSSLTVYATSRDAFGNFVANVAADAWSLPTRTGAVVGGDLVPASDSKSAVFTAHLNGTATVRATAGALAPTDSGTLTVGAGAPSRLVITSTPQILTAGANSSLITVQLQDALGNPANNTSSRTITLTSSSAGAVFRNAANTTDITTLTIPTGSNSTNYLFRATVVGLATITNSSPGLTAATQTEIVIPAAAAKLVVTTQPSSVARAGIVLPTQPQVTVQDVFGNTVGSFAAAITVMQSSGGNLNGSLVPASAFPASGVAIFSGLIMTNVGASTLTFTAPGVTGTNSALVTIGAGTPSRIRVETLANGAGTIVPTQDVDSGLAVTNFAIARDFYGNFVTNAAAAWSLASIDGDVAAGDLVPAPDNKSAVFTGHLRGSAKVHVAAGVLPVTDSGTFTVVQGTNDPDLPGASARFKVFPAGSLVIAMDNTLQSVVPPFNIKAYGLVNRLLQNYVPVSWAIRSGKPKDGVDFSAPAFRIAPSRLGTSNLDFAGGPFLIHRAYTNLALPHIAAFGNNVAVYQLTADAVVDIRHELRFRPSISVNAVNSSIHTALLDYAGITNYTITSDYNLSSNTCFTLFLEPHNGATTGVPSAGDFIRSGGNFLAECLAVATYENDPGGHFQSTTNIVTDNIGNTLAYSNPDLPYSQFIGTIEPAPGGSHQDWTMGGGVFKNHAHVHLDDIGASPAHYAATSSKHSVGPGGLLFYLGGHNYGAGGSDITLINGQRMVLNAVFVPSHRPTCGLDNTTDLTITKSDGVHTVTNGQPVTYTIVVANKGFDRVNGARVTDTFGPSLANVSWTAAGLEGATNFTAAGTGNLDTTVDLPVYSSVVFTVQGTIGYGPECLVTNIATVAAPEGLDDINPEDNIAIDVDHVVPPFVAPPDVLVSCTNLVPAAATNLAGFIAIGGSVGDTAVPYTVTYLGDADNGGAGCPANPLIIARTYRLATACDDFVDAVQTISVIDQTAPIIQCATNKTTTLGAVWSFDPPTATEGCSSVTISVMGTVTNSLCGAGFTATRTWQATDACGNASICNQTVTVIDMSVPVIICPPNKIVEAGTSWTFDAPNAGSHLVTVLDTTTNLGCGNSLTATRTWQAVNECGMSAQCSQTVSVLDTQPPAITCPGNLALHTDLGQCGRSNVTFVVTATDNGGVTNLVSTPASGSLFPVGVTIVTNTATDTCGNTSTCTFTVTITDDESPVITCPANLLLTADTGYCSRSNVTFVVTATDNCGVTNLVSRPASGSTFPVGVTTVTNTATDASGNRSTCTFTVTVTDNENPVITCPTNLLLTADAGHCSRSNVTFVVTATDNCSVANLVSSPASGSTFPIGTTTVSNTATDASGNTSTCTFTVTVTDNENPVITCPSNLVLTADAGYCSRSNVTFMVSATDNCGLTNLVSSPASGSTFPVGVTTVTNTATDASGNTSTCTFTVTVTDNENPVITCPGNLALTADAGYCSRSNVTFVVTATDNCSVRSLVSSPASGSTFPVGVTTVTNTATDASGNTSICTFTVTVTDNENPVITCPGNLALTADAGYCGRSNVTFVVTATDNCSVRSLVSTPASGSTFPVGVTTVTNTATDASGNTSICTFTVTVTDNENPVITCPSNLVLTADAGYCSRSNVIFVVTARDNCSVRELVSTPASGSTFPVGVTTVTNTATDASGNTSICTFTVTVTDNENPVITCPGNLALTADAGYCSRSNVTFVVTATDNCSVRSLVSTPASGSTFPVGVTTVTNTATDASGNTSTCTFTVTVTDNENPAITCPSNLVLTADAGYCSRSNVTFVVTATDNCSVRSLVSSPASGSTFPVGVTIVTNTATDASGNTSTCTFTVTVTDNENPAITCPSNLVLTADAGYCSRSNVTFVVTATDNCSVRELVSIPASGSTFPVGVTTVTNTATDASGNTSTCTFTVTIRDNENPVITCPSNLVLTADAGYCSRSNVTFVVTATDNCSVRELVSTPASGSTFPVGVTMVTNTATDASGNTSTCTFTVTIRDNENPVITCPSNLVLTADAGYCSRSNVTFAVTATDNCSVRELVSTPASGSTFPVGVTIVTNTATDASGNTSTCTFTVTVRDNENPVITCPSNMVLPADAGYCSRSNVTFVVTATDNCSVRELVSTPASGSTFPVGVTAVTNTATDASGNTSTCTFTVTIRDNENPVITCPSNLVLTADAGYCSRSNVTFVVTATDNCSVRELVSSPASGSTFPVGVTIVTNTATDASGNTSTCTFTVTVRDNENPVITCPTNLVLTADAGYCSRSNVTFIVTATDNCSVRELVSAPASGSTFPVGVTTVTNTATDASGNTSVCTFTVTVTDNENPVITCPTNLILTADPGYCSRSNVTFVVTATDNCSVRALVSTPASGSTFPVGVTTVTNTATDASGNTSTCTFTVTVTDHENPVITCPSNLVLTADAGYCSRSNVTFVVTATDNCSVRELVSTPASGSTFPVGVTIVTNMATDASGNTSTCTFTVTVRDTELPTVTCSSNLVFNADLGLCSRSNVTFIVTATDNCSVSELVSTPASGSTFPVGVTTVTNTATDASGNTSTCTFTVTVRDTQPPAITCPGNLTLNADLGQCSRSNVVFTVSASDDCSVTKLVSDPPSGSTFPIGTTTVTSTATDASGNSSTCTFTVTVRDTQPPTITPQPDVTVSAVGCTAANVVLGSPSVADNCSVASVVSNAPPVYPLGTNIVTWTVVDGSGNTTTATQRVIVLDTTPPTIVCPPDVTVPANAGCWATNVSLLDSPANLELIPAGSWVIPMDNNLQNLVPPFNLKAYGLANQVLQNWVPLKWAIRFGKGKDESDFTANVRRLFPSTNAVVTTNFAGGPFIIHRDYVPGISNVLRGFAISNNVAVYVLNQDTVVNIRYTLTHKPYVGVNIVNNSIHTNYLNKAGINNFVVIADSAFNTGDCYTLYTEPHTDATTGVTNVHKFVRGGGNFLAECKAVGSYENHVAGHFHSTAGFVNQNVSSPLVYTNCDQPFNQFVGELPAAPGGAEQDWYLPAGSVFTNNAQISGFHTTSSNFRASFSREFKDGPGGMVFYLGGHDYNGTDIADINGMRMYLNAVFVPVTRPLLCGLTRPETNCETVTVTSNAPAVYPPGTNYVVWTATDNSGNSNICVQRVIVIDTQPPVITTPSNLVLTADLGQCSRSNVTFVVTATDNCSVTNLVISPPSGSTFPVGVTTVTNMATDSSGNTSIRIFTVTVRDTQPPVITCPADMVLTADPGRCGHSNVTFTVSATDNCGVTNLVSRPPSGSTFPGGVTTVTNTATDASGNTSVCTFTVTVLDTQPPVITCPTNLILTANPGRCGRTNVTFTVTATDNCSVASVVSSPPSGSTFSVGTTMVTSTATDTSGNSSGPCTFMVTVLDTQPPAITCPSNMVLTADLGQCSRSNVTFTVTATDNCGVTNLVSSPPSGSTFPVGATIVTSTATDASGNSSTCTFTVTVRDTQPPVILCPSNLVLTADLGQCGRSNVTFEVTATDNCGVTNLVSRPPSGSTFPVGVTIVTNTATDASGNTSVCTFTVTVQDTQLPAILCPANLVLAADLGQCARSNVAFTVSATDNCSVASLVSSPPSGSTFPVGVTTVTSTATDASGNHSSCTFTVTVLDTQPPVIFCPTNLVLRADLGQRSRTNVSFAVVATDNCSVTNLVSSPPSGSTFPVGVTTVTNTATDASGNSSTCTFTVTVLDMQPPTISAPPDVIVAANAGCIATNVSLGTPTTSDNCAVASVVNNLSPYQSLATEAPPACRVASIQKLGDVVTVTWNSQVGRTYRLLYKDSLAAANWSVAAGDVTAVGTTTSQTDLAGGLMRRFYCVQSVGDAGLSSFGLGTNLVVWTATDTSGNTNSCVQRVIVRDAVAPTITCPSNLVLTADSGQPSRSNVTFTVSATDNCTLASLVSLPASGTTFPVGVTTVTNTATDASGNITVCTFTVTVIDNQSPVITCPSNLVLRADPGRQSRGNVTFTVSATDNCGVTNLVSSPPSGSTFQVGTTTVTSVATDNSGNSSTCSFTVTVNKPVGVVVAPTLAIRLDNGQAELSWSTNFTGFRLQSLASLGTSAAWVNVTNAPMASGGSYQVILNPSESARFFRLVNP